MRMRRKKNLEKRLENCSDYLLPLVIEKVVYGEERIKHILKLEEIFGNNNPIHLEIGCGKGQFATEIALRNPQINFIAVEINQSVIVQAIEKAKKANLKNLRFMLVGAQYLDLYLPEKSISRIYLNHSCPFPKKRQAKHRLTHECFLNLYKTLLIDGGDIRQKTDNMHFFEFSICELSRCGFVLSDVTLDLHNSDIENNIVTEYEKRFSDLGQPIYSLVATMK